MRVFSVIDAHDYEGFGPPSIFAHLCEALDEAERAHRRADWAEVRVHTEHDPDGEELYWFADHLGPPKIGIAVPRVSFCGSVGYVQTSG